MDEKRTPQQRRQLLLIIAIAIGLLAGFLIKRFKVGLVIGIVLGIIIMTLSSKRK
jgi:hypothetical protein